VIKIGFVDVCHKLIREIAREVSLMADQFHVCIALLTFRSTDRFEPFPLRVSVQAIDVTSNPASSTSCRATF
jgi:hypothetical protein